MLQRLGWLRASIDGMAAAAYLAAGYRRGLHARAAAPQSADATAAVSALGAARRPVIVEGRRGMHGGMAVGVSGPLAPPAGVAHNLADQ